MVTGFMLVVVVPSWWGRGGPLLGGFGGCPWWSMFVWPWFLLHGGVAH